MEDAQRKSFVRNISIGDFVLESGEVLKDVTLAYERKGKSNAPVILVCHPLTGNQNAVGSEDSPGWWSGLIGPGKAIDLNRYQTITFNVLGGCSGSTGPASREYGKKTLYRSSFPAITIRDMVHVQKIALNLMGFIHLAAVIGGSLGGMQAYEWGVSYPAMVDKLILFAATPFLTDYAIAFNKIAIEAIRNDPAWNGGDYESCEGMKGFEIARMTGMLTYRSPHYFTGRFQRKTEGSHSFQIESYLQHQASRLTKRFDANSYLTLIQALNTHDIGRGRGGWKKAAANIEAEVTAFGFEHDPLYPLELIKEFTELAKNGRFISLPTPLGHDGFLAEYEKWEKEVILALNPNSEQVLFASEG